MQNLTKHLQELLDHKGHYWLSSYEAISTSCYEVYEEWRESDRSGDRSATVGARLRTSLDAEVYREDEDVVAEYYIFPRQNRQSRHAELTAHYQGERWHSNRIGQIGTGRCGH